VKKIQHSKVNIGRINC